MNNEKVFKITSWPKCNHSNYLVDTSLQEVECGKCGKKLNPMYVIEQMCNAESQQRHRLSELKKEVENTELKMKCKCQHCKQMTRIQR